MDKNIMPMPGYVLVGIDQEKKVGGFYVERNEGAPKVGTVMAVGKLLAPLSVLETDRYSESPVNTGDVIYFKQYSGQEVEVDGYKYCFVSWNDILGVQI